MRQHNTHRTLTCMLALAALMLPCRGAAQTTTGTPVVTTVEGDTIRHAIAEQLVQDEEVERVIVGKDTVSILVPEKNYGRFDRGLFNYLFTPRGQWTCGIQASYGEVSSGDTQLLRFFKDIDFNMTAYSIKPYFSYFYRHNRAMGLRLGYTNTKANINSFNVDIIDDISFDLKDVKYYTHKFSAELFHRNYIGLGRSRRFAFFQEVAFQYGSGRGTFQRNYDEKPRITKTESTDLHLNFSPGLCVFIQEKVACNFSIGVFSWYWTKEHQVTNGVDEGNHTSSGANFKINLFNLALGVSVYI